MIARTWIQMGMPVTVCIRDAGAGEADIAAVAALLAAVDDRFSPYRAESELSRLNDGAIALRDASEEFRAVLRLCEHTREETNGYFDVRRGDRIDPSGLVKGWAIQRASDLLAARGFRHYIVDAGGDIQTSGLNDEGQPWRVGIRNPFQRGENVKVLAISGEGVATSGISVRGDHIYDPHRSGPLRTNLASLTVIGPSIYDADRFATAAFAMGRDAGLAFIAAQPDLEAYAIESNGMATYTPGVISYVR